MGMSKIISYILLSGIVLAAAIVINTTDVGARQQTDFIQISVLAHSQANYGIDENTMTIPAVSMEIIEDAVHDARVNSSIRVITYTSLPVKDEKPENEDLDLFEEFKHINDPGNENNGNKDKDKEKDNNGNDQNKDKDNNGNGQDKDKDNNGNDQKKGKDQDKDNNGNGSNQSRDEKEAKPGNAQ